MGFSTIGAGVVLVVGALFVGAMLLNAVFDAQRDVVRGFEDDRDRRALERAATASLADGNHDGDTLHLNVTTDGGTALDAARLVLLLDGVWSNDAIASRTVDGESTDVWAPREVLYLQAAAGSPPQRAYLVLETGLGVGWTPA